MSQENEESSKFIYLPTYDGFGPNSNGFVRALIEEAGGQVELPGTAFGEEIESIYKNTLSLQKEGPQPIEHKQLIKQLTEQLSNHFNKDK